MEQSPAPNKKPKALLKGRVEDQLEARQEIARKLLQENLPINLIASTTGLSKTEVEALRP